MTQPPNPIPSRAARPQLFAEPGARKPDDRSNGHADFGPSILATIDGKQTGSNGTRAASPFKRVLLMAVLAMVIAAVYIGFKSSQARASTSPQPESLAVVSTPAIASPPAVVAPAASQPMEQGAGLGPAQQGAASIESVLMEPSGVAATGALQKALESPPDDAPKKADVAVKPEPKAESKVAGKAANPTRTAAASTSQPKPAKKSKASADSDAELLAAMLPHLTRLSGGPTSPAYEKRCGNLTGDAEASCRARFCNGRQGTDAACPASTAP